MKDEKNLEEFVYPLKKYDYVEPKKKPPYNKYLLYFLILLFISLFFVLIYVLKTKQNKNEVEETTTTTTTVTTTTTTTTEEEIIITEKINCTNSSTIEGMTMVSNIQGNFSDSKLQTISNVINVKLLDTKYLNDFNYQRIGLELALTDFGYEYEITENNMNHEYTITMIIDTKKSNEFGFTYNENINSVKQKLLDSDYICN